MIELRVPIGRRPRLGDVVVQLDDSSRISLNLHWRGGSDALTFDEAEQIAAALRDVALVVRMRHNFGMTEVA